MVEALRQVLDPELGIDIVDLGLIYRLVLDAGGVRVLMTMTSPACPASAQLAREAESAVRRGAPDLRHVEVQLVWDPPWQPAFMTEAAKRRLGWSG